MYVIISSGDSYTPASSLLELQVYTTKSAHISLLNQEFLGIFNHFTINMIVRLLELGEQFLSLSSLLFLLSTSTLFFDF